MAEFDIVVRNGEIHDGLGGVAKTGDVAISNGRIAEIGKVTGRGREELDASGRIVTPGFVDVHTHYDGQATWENRLTPSANHGVTTIVMGNCGVGFAPCKPHQRNLLIEVMEGVEDVPEVVMTAGLPWNWETFPEYLDALDGRRFDMDVATQLPHSALRVYVMGERATGAHSPTADDLEQMRTLTRQAVEAGALGVSTSRNLLHRTRRGELAPSLHSESDELLALAHGLADAGRGVYQIIGDIVGDAEAEFQLMRRLAEAAHRPLSFSLLQMPTGDPHAWRKTLRLLEHANADGIAMKAQVFPRPVGVLYGLDLSFHPFSLHPSFRKLTELPLPQKVKAMRDPVLRAQLLSEKAEDPNPVFVKTVNNFRFGYLMGDPPNYRPNTDDMIERQAARRGMTPHEYAYDLLLKDDGHSIIFLPGANYRNGNLDAVHEMISDPNTILGLGDGGAHYGLICDGSFPTSYLKDWVRDGIDGRKHELPKAVQALTSKPAQAVGLCDRGILAQGFKADLNVIDLAGLKLHRPIVVRDLPASGRRLQQYADGYVATITSGAFTYRTGQHTGLLPGRLIRGEQAKPL